MNDAENELRGLIIKKLDSLETGLNEIRTEVAGLKVELAKTGDCSTEIKELREKVDGLRLWKAQVVGVVIAVNAVVLMVGWAVQSWIFYHKG